MAHREVPLSADTERGSGFKIAQFVGIERGTSALWG